MADTAGIRFVGLRHDCDLPGWLGVEVGEQASYQWRCPECRQRWFVREGWRNRDAERVGRASRRWRKQRAAELTAQTGDDRG